jgi:hypothetical protein
MLRRPDIDHILRAAASLSGHGRFVMVGTGAVIATAPHIPLALMMTEEIDIYVENAPDSDRVSDLIDASIRRDSSLLRTCGRLQVLLQGELPDAAPAGKELTRRLTVIAAM